MRRLTRHLVGSILLVGASIGQAAAAQWDLPALMQLLAKHPAGRVQFTETKSLAVLDQPVVSTGELVYRPPDRLEKHTLKPKPETVIVEGNNLSVVREGVKRDLRLPQYPEVLAFIEALRGTLVGNQALLQQHYGVAVTGSERDWRLVLTPLDERMLRWVKQINVSGAGSNVMAVETLQSDGDKSVIAVTPAVR